MTPFVSFSICPTSQIARAGAKPRVIHSDCQLQVRAHHGTHDARAKTPMVETPPGGQPVARPAQVEVLEHPGADISPVLRTRHGPNLKNIGWHSPPSEPSRGRCATSQ